MLLHLGSFITFTPSTSVLEPRLACSKSSNSGERCEVKKAMKVEGERGAGTLVRIFNKSMFRYTRSWYTLRLVDFDSFCQEWSVFDHREKCDMAQQKVERLRSQRGMRYGGDDRLYVPSRRIRTRNKHSAE